ncbi:hypothetical protein MKEN_00855700 [Mycena kentingensis (nom. inval.)]|nr:hypothetical protein MKEN_00855700 [Mycena kentingensis (nom. inval.)]
MTGTGSGENAGADLRGQASRLAIHRAAFAKSFAVSKAFTLASQKIIFAVSETDISFSTDGPATAPPSEAASPPPPFTPPPEFPVGVNITVPTSPLTILSEKSSYTLPIPVTQQEPPQSMVATAVYATWTFLLVAPVALADEVVRQAYLHLLLRIPSLYFSRVTKIFEEARLSLPEIKHMARARADEWNNTTMPNQYLFLSRDVDVLPPHLLNFKASWDNFISSLLREWKTLNVISVLLMSAILTLLQIDVASHPIIRTTALFSLICSLMSLLYGCIYIIRFGSMRKMHKASSFATDAQRKVGFWWNVWVMLAMPAIWLAWSIITFIASILSFIWLSGSVADVTGVMMSERAALGQRIALSGVFALGLLYFTLIVREFHRYGDPLDRAWKRAVGEWANSYPTQQPAAWSYQPHPPMPQPPYVPHGPPPDIRFQMRDNPGMSSPGLFGPRTPRTSRSPPPRPPMPASDTDPWRSYPYMGPGGRSQGSLSTRPSRGPTMIVPPQSFAAGELLAAADAFEEIPFVEPKTDAPAAFAREAIGLGLVSAMNGETGDRGRDLGAGAARRNVVVMHLGQETNGQRPNSFGLKRARAPASLADTVNVEDWDRFLLDVSSAWRGELTLAPKTEDGALPSYTRLQPQSPVVRPDAPTPPSMSPSPIVPSPSKSRVFSWMRSIPSSPEPPGEGQEAENSPRKLSAVLEETSEEAAARASSPLAPSSPRDKGAPDTSAGVGDLPPRARTPTNVDINPSVFSFSGESRPRTISADRPQTQAVQAFIALWNERYFAPRGLEARMVPGFQVVGEGWRGVEYAVVVDVPDSALLRDTPRAAEGDAMLTQMVQDWTTPPPPRDSGAEADSPVRSFATADDRDEQSVEATTTPVVDDRSDSDDHK